MCGRFTLIHPVGELAAAFAVEELPPLQPRYNIAPTQPVLAIRPAAAGREAVCLRWGLIPAWAADASIGSRLLNARAETLTDKPSFRTAFQRRRCLIPADGFYEWQSVAGKKQPLRFRLADGGLFALAGLWERWPSPGGPVVESCTVVTTTANELVRPVHERMPVILAPADHAAWLAADSAAARLLALLRPYPAEAMAADRASSQVNSPRHEGPDCLAVA